MFYPDMFCPDMFCPVYFIRVYFVRVYFVQVFFNSSICASLSIACKQYGTGWVASVAHVAIWSNDHGGRDCTPELPLHFEHVAGA